MGWTIVAEAAARGRIEAYDRTRCFGFVDDIVVRLRAEGAGTRVDLRSASRVGISDLGKNAERIAPFWRRSAAEEDALLAKLRTSWRRR